MQMSVRALMTVSRWIIGLTFIFSGFVKVIDPVGTGLIMGEYFKIVGISAASLALVLGVSTAVLELLLGFAVLMGLRMKISANVILLFMVFFTFLTLYLAIFNPITHCGCFGEAIVLTHWQSFGKNLLLLLLAVILYKYRDSYRAVAPEFVEWGVVIVAALFMLGLSVHSYRHLPMMDFMNYRVDTELNTRGESSSGPLFETTFIYSKDGKKYEFDIDNLPDSTYTFVDSKTVQVGGKADSSADFSVTGRGGGYVTEYFTAAGKTIFIATAPLIERVGKRASDKIRELADSLSMRGVELALLTGSAWDKIDIEIERLNLSAITVYNADYKMLLTMNRSSLGILYLDGGRIISKWAWRDAPTENLDELLDGDSELLAVKARIGEKLSAEFSILVIVLIALIGRYICRKIFSRRKVSKGDTAMPAISDGIISQNVDMSGLTTLGIKAVAQWYAKPSSIAEIKAILADSSWRGVTSSGRVENPMLIIGSGSNILFCSELYKGLVIHPAIKGIEIVSDNSDYIFLRVGAGVVWDEFVEYCVDRGWGGLENLSKIPGCVGASPVQNVGAYGSEAKDIIEKVEFIYVENGEDGQLDNAGCKFGYRDSIFKGELKSKVIVTYVTFKLSKLPVINNNYADLSEMLSMVETPSIYDVRMAITAIRDAKLPDPAKIGNAGSFFKNPVIEKSVAEKLCEEYPDIKTYPATEGYIKLSAAWLIDQCGFKGVRKGNVGVHDKQALVLVAYPGATGKDLVTLAEEIRSAVIDKFGVTIEPEVQIV